MAKQVGELYQVDYDRNADDAPKWERVNFALRRISASLDQQSAAGGTADGTGGGVTDHSKLTNLGYSASGHTGFAPTAHVHIEGDVTNLVTDLAAKAPGSRNINTTAPLAGGGDLSADRTLFIPKATAAVDGYLDKGDFATFDSKQAALGFTPENIANKGAVSGYAPLDAGQKVPTANLGGAGADNTKFLRGDQSWVAAGGVTAHSALTGLVAPADDHTQYLLISGARAMTGHLGPAVVTLADAATISTDASLGNHFRVTLGGNRTLGTPGNAYDGQILRYEFIQDATGGRTITMGNNIVKPSNIPTPILTSAIGATDMLQLVYNSSNSKFVITGFLTNIYGV